MPGEWQGRTGESDNGNDVPLLMPAFRRWNSSSSIEKFLREKRTDDRRGT